MVPDSSRPLVSYRGEYAGEMFVRKLQEETEQLFQEYIATPQQLPALTEAELRFFHTAVNCRICVIIVTLWDSLGVAYSRCNLAYRISTY